ncbi:MAG: D-aminoacyl-tRNA deacylase [Eubacteriales bacterium]|jgi:D-tyrosyl-tRNA(Tyr) deacylase
MKFVIQRVQRAAVTVDGQEIGAIDKGFLVLVGVEDSDTEAVADWMVRKMTGLRIFEDEQGLTNKNLASVGGELLIVSQFTLYADCRKGNRPSFIRAGKPEHANALYEYIIRKCAETVPVVRHGEFGADMKVSLVNDGPFTIVLDSDEIMPKN